MHHQKRPLQVIILGHKLSRATAIWLKKQGPYVVFRVYFHIPSFDKVTETVREVFNELHAQGCDLSGQTPTVFQAAGSSIGALAVAAHWMGLTGNLPRVLNLIRISDEEYGPSRELPVVDLAKYEEEIRHECQVYGPRIIQETAETAEIADDGLVLQGVLNMGQLKNEGRQLRAQLEEPKRRAALEGSRAAYQQRAAR